MFNEKFFFTATKEDEKIRLDKWLVSKFPKHSRNYFQYLIDNQYITVNNSPIKKRMLLKEGDQIAIFFEPLPEITLEPENIPLDILYEDEHLLIINKPANLVVHPAPGHPKSTFVNALLFHCENLEAKDNIRPGIVHRLDKETSGVLIAAKTTKAHQQLIEQFAARQIKKIYIAICLGNLKNITVSQPIARHPTKRKEMTIIETGKEAITDFACLTHNETYCVVLARPLTGRTHQIRVHLKHLKTPVLGDQIYGSNKTNKQLKIPRTLLHCYQMTFIHPISNQPLCISAPLPQEMLEWIQKINRDFSLSLVLS